MSNLQDLPIELIDEIVLSLSGTDTINLLQANKALYQILNDPNVWKQKLFVSYPSLPSVTEDYEIHYMNLEQKYSKLIPLYFQNSQNSKSSTQKFITTLYLHHNMHHGQLVEMIENEIEIENKHLARVRYYRQEQEFINTSFTDLEPVRLDQYPEPMEDEETGELMEMENLWTYVTKIVVGILSYQLV